MLRKHWPIAWVLAAPAAGAQESLMVVESTNDAVMLFDSVDGDLLNPTFIDLSAAGASTPIEAVVVGDEIWVSDQVLDGVMRFDAGSGTWLGTITGGLDNLRGLELAGSSIYLANSGTDGGAPGDAVVVLDPAGTILTSWPVDDPFDVLEFGADLLVSDIAGEDLDLYDVAGSFLGTFHDSDGVTGIDFPEQLSHGNGGNVLAAGFSNPSGIYEYDSTGAQVSYYDTGAIAGQTGLRGVWQLGNGNILYTNGNGVHVLDPGALVSTTVVSGVSARFISSSELLTIQGQAKYRIVGSSTGAQFCIRIVHCGMVADNQVTGLSLGDPADVIVERIVSTINASTAMFIDCDGDGIRDVTAEVDPSDRTQFKMIWTTMDPLTLEVGPPDCGGFCTVTVATPCSFNPMMTLVEESDVEPGQALCFCDGEHGPVPCGNAGAAGAGCANSAGPGATLRASGSDSVSAGDAVLLAGGAIPGQPGLFFQGDAVVANGDGAVFGDGQRCCGQGVVRLEIVVPDASGSAATSVDVSAEGGAQPGDTRCYQLWYRDPAGPCSSTFNLSNGYAISWSG